MGELIGVAHANRSQTGLALPKSQPTQYNPTNQYIKISTTNKYYFFVVDIASYCGGYVAYEKIIHCGALPGSKDAIIRSNDIGNKYYRNDTEVVMVPSLQNNVQTMIRIDSSNKLDVINIELIDSSSFNESEYTAIE